MKRSINFNGAKVFYTIQGSGIPVLLLHGFGESGSIWKDLSSGLSDYKVIIPDLPGSGSSEALEQVKVSLSDFASCIALILSQEQIVKFHFIGHSMGGYIAMEFASMYPEKLSSLSLFHSSAYADDKEKIETRRKAIGFIENHGSSAFLKTSIPGLFKDADLHIDAVNALIEEGGSFLSKTLVQYYEAMIERKDHPARLSTLKVPVLFLIGEHDKAVPLDISLKQCYLPHISFVHILRGSAHMSMYEEPDWVKGLIQDFLNEVVKA